ncbi:hypothetical protein EC988_001983 [Linderina pennispora]|nr:hypothetical protein EC988_001983 [Linderina pennispora]
MISDILDIVSQIKVDSGADVSGQSGTQPRTELTTGVQPIDDVLAQQRDSVEQAGRAPIFELIGLPGSGKTQLVYRISATLAMPLVGGGHETHVAIIDMAGKFDVRQQKQHIEQRLGKGIARESMERMVDGALSRIHVFSPLSTASAIATLGVLGKQRQFGGLLIDGLGSNHRIDHSEGAPIRLASRKATGQFRMQQVLVDTLVQVQQQMGCVVVVTNVVIMRARSTAEDSGHRIVEIGKTLYRDHMIPRWRCVLARSFVVEAARSGSETEISVGQTRVMRAGQ